MDVLLIDSCSIQISEQYLAETRAQDCRNICCKFENEILCDPAEFYQIFFCGILFWPICIAYCTCTSKIGPDYIITQKSFYKDTRNRPTSETEFIYKTAPHSFCVSSHKITKFLCLSLLSLVHCVCTKARKSYLCRRRGLYCTSLQRDCNAKWDAYVAESCDVWCIIQNDASSNGRVRPCALRYRPT